jgi:formylglycine-generating enzyme required for sulfatase activity
VAIENALRLDREGKPDQNFKDWGRGTRPVIGISWYDAKAFVGWLNKKTGSDDAYRLLSEAEWEYAARGGTAGARYGELDKIAWYVDNSGGVAHPVRQKEPNAFGLYDMLGNALEWTGGAVLDLSLFQTTDPQNLEGDFHPLRGGGWWDSGRLVRASYRIHQDFRDIDYNFGFRCAMD